MHNERYNFTFTINIKREIWLRADIVIDLIFNVGAELIRVVYSENCPII